MTKTRARKSKRLVYGVGIYEPGKYRAKINGKHTSEYISWRNMLKRCYSEKNHQKEPTYIGCTVCDSWIYFQQYAEWYHNNFYQVERQIMNLDKDILVRGNKTYSPNTCIFVPAAVNTLLISCKAKRGDLPIGMTRRSNGKIQVQCRNSKGKQEKLGCYDTEEEAFKVYKPFKERVIKEVIQRYEDLIPSKYYKKLYLVLSKYEVRIDD